MNRLIWKELNEQRYVPLAYAALLCVILLIWDVMGDWVANHGGNGLDRMSFSNATIVLWCGLLITGLFPGSNAIASEAGQGTLGLLFAIPITRGKIWMSKVVAGVIVMLASAATMLTLFFVVAILAFPTKIYQAIHQLIPSHVGIGWLPLIALGAVVVYIFIASYGYSAALFCSTITDRPIAAAGIAIVLALGLLYVLNVSSPLGSPVDGFVVELGSVVLVVGFFLASWLAFRLGSGSNTAKRRSIGAGVLTAWLGMSYLIAASTAWYLHNLAQMTMPRVTRYAAQPTGWWARADGKFGLLDVAITYDRVKVGDVYSGTVKLPFSPVFGARSLKVTCTSQIFGTEIVTQRGFLYMHGRQVKADVGYLVHYNYIPPASARQDHQTIYLIAPGGQVKCRILISAHTSNGYVPPINWFPDLLQRNEQVISQESIGPVR